MNYKFSDIAVILTATQTLIHKDGDIETIYFDSRKIYSAAHGLFIALPGKSHDGHDYIDDAISRGVKYFIVSQIDSHHSEMANFIVVPNTLAALQKLAQQHRNQFNNPVIGITGSNGKTMIKEWLSQSLSTKHKIAKNPRSYNSQLGLPLAVLSLSSDDTFGVFEAGISRKGEMKLLAAILAPTIGILSNIGSAHDEGFKNFREKLSEKLLLFKKSEALIYCQDDPLVKNGIDKRFKDSKTLLLTWSEIGAAKVFYQTITQEKDSVISIEFNGNSGTLKAPFIDPVSLYNLKHVIACLLFLKWDIKEIQKAIDTLEPVEMRYNLVAGIYGSQILADMYSMDLSSFRIAVDHLVSHATGIKTCVVFSDFLGSGLNEGDRAKELAKILNDRKVDMIIGIGENLVANVEMFKAKQKLFYPNTESLLAQIDLKIFENHSVLLKGARKFRLEALLKILRYQSHPTRLEIDLNALGHNLGYYRSLLDPGVKVMVMVKALSYGAGSFEIAKFLELERVDYLAVAFSDEGIALREKNIRLPIIVLNPNPENFTDLIQYNLEPEIYDLEGLQIFIEKIKLQSILQPYPIHIKIETGMNRLGLTASEIPDALKLINENNVRLQSVFSHLSASDDIALDDFTHTQINRFNEIKKLVLDQIEYPVLFHILNSSGIINYPSAQFDMVRLGIGLYGFSPDPKIQKKLRVVSSLKSVISQIKKIKKGNSVGYNCSFIAESEMEIAIVPVGYADGFMRSLSNGKSSVQINGELAPVVGNICMDMFMADVTKIDCKKGDEVEIFGEKISISRLAQAAGTIPYEILSRISSRVPRVYFQE